MGLLDTFTNMNPEQTQGLLAAAAQVLQQSGDPRRPFGLGQAAGLGIETMQASTEAARQRKLQEEQARQMAQLRGFQIQEAQGGLADHQRARDEADRLRQFYMGQRMPGAPAPQATPMPAGQPATGMLGSLIDSGGALPQPAPAAPPASPPAVGPNPFEQRMAMAQQLRQAGFHEQADAQEAAALKFKPKYSATPQKMTGRDGKLGLYQLSEDGSPPVNVGLGVAPDMVEVGLGDRKQFVDRNTLTPGQQFKMGLSPDAAAGNAVTMRGQNLKFATDSEANGVARSGIVSKRIQDLELKMQDDYRAESKGFAETSTAMKKVFGAIDTADKNPGSALAAGTAFMKILDPNSVVRESELGMALNASGWFDRALNMANVLQNGRVMTAQQKLNLKQAASDLFNEAKAAQLEVDNAYRKRAKDYGADPERVIVDRGQNGKQNPAPAAGNIKFLGFE